MIIKRKQPSCQENYSSELEKASIRVYLKVETQSRKMQATESYEILNL